jgi:hypothetical protein
VARKVTDVPPLVRYGEAEPWKYGPYRVVVARRVTEEEQISVECYEPTLDAARETYDSIMSSMRRNMIAYNEEVVLVNQGKLSQLDRMIERRGENVRALDASIKERREWLLSKGLDASDIPLFEDDDA